MSSNFINNYDLVFESEKIYYVKLSYDLINDYLVMVNDPDVASFISHNVRTYSYDEEVNWVDSKLKEEALCFSMIEKSTGEYIGNIEFMSINDKVGEIGIAITSGKQNKGYGREAIKAIINYGYEKLGLDGFELNVFLTNLRAIRCYESVGFVKVGSGKTDEDIHMKYSR